jgi:hypothetical protein
MNRSAVFLCLGVLALTAACSKQNSTEPQAAPPADSTMAPPAAAPDASTPPADNSMAPAPATPSDSSTPPPSP